MTLRGQQCQRAAVQQGTLREPGPNTGSAFRYPVATTLGPSQGGSGSLDASESHCPPRLTSGKIPTGLAKTHSSSEPPSPRPHLPSAPHPLHPSTNGPGEPWALSSRRIQLQCWNVRQTQWVRGVRGPALQDGTSAPTSSGSGNRDWPGHRVWERPHALERVVGLGPGHG